MTSRDEMVKLRETTPMEPERAIEFLLEAARYFEKRPTNGEDRAFWSNTYNARNCRKIAALIQKDTSHVGS